ncbi:MAG: hypothetical protein Q4G39_05980 [Brachymonas sp.]|nr:hypothetical protein [Brachymonas sp.]
MVVEPGMTADTADATTRLRLDARQRAMLEEMGIRLWLPQEKKSGRTTG